MTSQARHARRARRTPPSRDANGTSSQPVGVNGGRAQEWRPRVPLTWWLTWNWSTGRRSGSQAKRARRSVRSIAWTVYSTGVLAMLNGVVNVRDYRLEPLRRAGGRTVTGQAMNIFQVLGWSAPPRRLRRPAAVARRRVRRRTPRIGRIASRRDHGAHGGRADLVAAAQSLLGRSLSAQRALAFGSPARPGGRLIVRSRTCSLPEDPAWIVTSGCGPPSDFGVTLNEGTSNGACAIAGRSKATGPPGERTHRGAPASERPASTSPAGTRRRPRARPRTPRRSRRGRRAPRGSEAGGCLCPRPPRAARRAGARPSPGRGRP